MLNLSNFETVEVEFNSSYDMKKDVGKECLFDISHNFRCTGLDLGFLVPRVTAANSHLILMLLVFVFLSQ